MIVRVVVRSDNTAVAPNTTMRVDLADWPGWLAWWRSTGVVRTVTVWGAPRCPLGKWEHIPGHGLRQVAVGRHPLPSPRKASAVRPFRHLPSTLTVPVMGVSFREESVAELKLLLSIAASIEHPNWEPRQFKPGPWRDAIQTAVETEGSVPARLEPEPTNPYDPHAVRVVVPALGPEFEHIGYLPARTHGCPARAVSDDLARGVRWEARITKVRVHDDHPDRPGIDVTLTRTEGTQP